MKRIINYLIFILISINTFGQKFDNDILCSSDTITIDTNLVIFRKNTIDSLNPYRVIICEKKSKLGYRFELGAYHYWYNKNTQDWLGNHFSPNVSFSIVYNKFNLGFRFKPWTVNPKHELQFGGETLTKEANLNPIKMDFYFGYSFDFDVLSIEPYLGVSKNSFIVINEEELNKNFSIPNVVGFINGITFNKYFKIKKYKYISVFGNVGYCIVPFNKVHENLSNNYFECSIGIAYKGFFPQYFRKRIE
ncbi:MAG: hypothetical protein H6Q16_60 [Bacteroidetes bacterium]|nr:hypothetical protein [Bacteroidota bacterium]